jgi:hypothetical protein
VGRKTRYEITARDYRAALNPSGAVAGSCDPERARGNCPPSRHRPRRMNTMSCLSSTQRGFRPPRPF